MTEVKSLGRGSIATVAVRWLSKRLLLAGRATVGMPQSRCSQAKDAAPDHLDDLIDQLDQCELQSPIR